MDQPNYTTIVHDARLKLGLTCEEYCVADMIYHLSKNPDNKANGWCYASKDTIAKYMGIGRASIYRILQKLIKEELIEKHPEQTQNLKTTAKWYTSVVIRPSQNETTSIKMRQRPSQNDTHYRLKMIRNNNNDNHNYNYSEKDKVISPERLEIVKSEIYRKIGRIPGKTM